MASGTEFEAWICDCHLVEIGHEEGQGEAETGPQTEYQCQAAVWSDSAEALRGALEAHAAPKGLKVLWIEEALSAALYVARRGNQQFGASPGRAYNAR